MNFDRILAQLRERLCRSRQRLLIWVSGDEHWCRELLAGPLLPWLQGQGVLVGEQPVAGLVPTGARQVARLLGQTIDFAVMDAFAGFNPNTFGQLCGMVEGGGCMVLMTPPSEQWGYFADPEYASLCVEPYLPSQLRGHYLLHLVRTLESSPELLHWAQGREPVVPAVPETETVPAVNLPCRSRDQQEAVALVLKASGARRQPLVLSADRGRGKSAALGIAAAELLRAGKKVVVTAVSRNAIDSLLERVETLAPDHCHLLHYYRPDELLRREEQADLLLVDEAAAIPTPLLLQLLDIYPRVVFATTLHGYEGNGQGFALRFLSRLRTGYPRCREYRLSTPIRWTAPDPLEQLGNRMLLLDVDAGKPGSQEGEPEIVCVDRQVLVEDTALLRDLFGLLVLAHYRTTPGDLRILLDSPNMRVYLAHSAGAPLGCVLLAEEGPLPDGLAQAVWEGRRRPRGHLLPQTLIAQEGWLEVAPWRSLRVVRIAVHPAAQKRGIGRRMLRTIERDARAACVDYLGASFAASDELLAFWQGSGFLPLRLGEQRDPVAGTHALLVLKPLSAAVQEWLPQARRWYRQSLLQRIPGVLQDLEPELLPALLRGTAGGGVLSPETLRRIRGFTDAQRSLESSLLPLIELLQASVHRWDDWQLSTVDQRLLCERILRQRSPGAVAEPGGKRAQLDRLRRLCGLLLANLVAE